MSLKFFMQLKLRTSKSNLRWKIQRWEAAGYVSGKNYVSIGIMSAALEVNAAAMRALCSSQRQ